MSYRSKLAIFKQIPFILLSFTILSGCAFDLIDPDYYQYKYLCATDSGIKQMNPVKVDGYLTETQPIWAGKSCWSKLISGQFQYCEYRVGGEESDFRQYYTKRGFKERGIYRVYIADRDNKFCNSYVDQMINEKNRYATPINQNFISSKCIAYEKVSSPKSKYEYVYTKEPINEDSLPHKKTSKIVNIDSGETISEFTGYDYSKFVGWSNVSNYCPRGYPFLSKAILNNSDKYQADIKSVKCLDGFNCDVIFTVTGDFSPEQSYFISGYYNDSVRSQGTFSMFYTSPNNSSLLEFKTTLVFPYERLKDFKTNALNISVAKMPSLVN